MGNAILEIIVMLLVAAILGFIIAWIIRKSRISELENELANLKAKNNKTEAELATLTVEHKTSLENCSNEAAKFKQEINDLNKANTNLSDVLKTQKEKYKNLEITNKIDAEKLKLEILAFGKKNETLSLSQNLLQEKHDTLVATNKAHADKYSLELAAFDKINVNLATEITNLKDSYNKEKEASKNNTKQLKDELLELNTKNELLINEASKWEQKYNNCIENSKKIQPKAEPKKPTTKEAETLIRIQEKAKNINFAQIGTASESEKDDLKIIKGIGLFIEKKLNAIGIYTFKQISNFSEKDKDMVNETIEFFSGRVRRDDWVGQATELLRNKN